ncbi:transcriptional regulator, AraC family protein [Pedobacter sp. BAL39]|uniref:AraC family transcriptional regulator n=1 Tax=Pedobacter sp. BAL39 TaxID=391596 RepID=UPI00015595F3|nr:AraC family transcriptional regulator [Pedobacter sp. BAL39]EDM38019.1 transcriptional regulator, AraC family protein [Pedobacter sp. BAL39]
MNKSEIPRFELERFAEEHFKVPFLNVEHYPIGGSYFIVKNRDQHPVNDYISANRRQFFKIFHITAGTGILTVGLHQYPLSPGDIAFLHPDEIMSWQTTSDETGGHFCLIHPAYFDHAEHLLQLFRQYPYFNPAKAVIQLPPEKSLIIDQYFKSIMDEAGSLHDDKKQAILLHLQMILLESQRAGKTLADVAVPDSYRYIYGFLNLLESTFQINDPQSIVKIKTAAEFAAHLNVHPNYLNSLVKNQTGKTLRAHIQERLLYEAKTLLIQTDWDIRTISYVLGFAEHGSFSSFFNKKENIPPSQFRENAGMA